MKRLRAFGSCLVLPQLTLRKVLNATLFVAKKLIATIEANLGNKKSGV
jgi:hypothetical protein